MSLKLEDHVFRVLENQKRMFDFLGEYDWAFDMNRGLLTFSKQRKRGLTSLFKKNANAEVLAECSVQILGTHSNVDKTWLWAWANTASEIPQQLTRGIEQVRQEGLQQDIPQFTRETLPLPQDIFGDMLAIICTGYLGLFTYMACPYPDGAMFVSIEKFPQVEAQPRNAMTVIQTIQAGITALSFPHRDAVHAYLGNPTVDGDSDHLTYHIGDEQIEIRFDNEGRIADMGARLKQPS